MPELGAKGKIVHLQASCANFYKSDLLKSLAIKVIQRRRLRCLIRLVARGGGCGGTRPQNQGQQQKQEVWEGFLHAGAWRQGQNRPLAGKLRSPVAGPGFFTVLDSDQASIGHRSARAAFGGLPSMQRPAIGKR